ncbi:MAG: transcriptional repressor [Clostridiaceae bacterium]|nr:transcriptional repressor [Clostridiaceae bacterium]
MKTEKDYKEMLRKRNLRSTRHRKSILAELEKSKLPMTAEDLFIKLKSKNISISISTVYRVLDVLVENGLAIQSNLPGANKAIYALNNKEHHHHLICIKCRDVYSLEGCPLKDYERSLENRLGFSIEGHTLEIFGYCQECKEK